MNNKKGFMFVETIITLTVLIALLLAVYAIFVNMLQKEKVTAEYDDYGDKYSLFYVKQYIINQQPGYIEDNKGKIVTKKKDFNYSDLQAMAIISCETKELNTSGASREFKDYLAHVKKTFKCDDESQYIISGEFKADSLRDISYSYASILHPNIPR